MGTFQIYSVSATGFSYQMRAEPTSSTAAGSVSCWRERELFDTVLRSLPENTTVRLGPGVLETKGDWHWRPKSGQRILGSGMGVTTLKLVGANVINYLHRAIANFYNESLTGFEVSDLTVDCNLPGQPVTPGYERARVACGAISATGQQIRIRPVRAINFGTQGVALASANPPPPDNPECFVIAAAGAYIDGNPDAFDCVIEDCIVEKPSQNNTRETTCIILGAGEAGYRGFMSLSSGVRGPQLPREL